MELPERQRLQNLSSVIRKKEANIRVLSEKVQKDGYVRVPREGEVGDVTEVPELLPKSKQHNIDARLTVLSSRRVFVAVPLISIAASFVLQKAGRHSTLWTTLAALLSIMPAQFVALRSRVVSISSPSMLLFGSSCSEDGLGIIGGGY